MHQKRRSNTRKKGQLLNQHKVTWNDLKESSSISESSIPFEESTGCEACSSYLNATETENSISSFSSSNCSDVTKDNNKETIVKTFRLPYNLQQPRYFYPMQIQSSSPFLYQHYQTKERTHFNCEQIKPYDNSHIHYEMQPRNMSGSSIQRKSVETITDFNDHKEIAVQTSYTDNTITTNKKESDLTISDCTLEDFNQNEVVIPAGKSCKSVEDNNHDQSEIENKINKIASKTEVTEETIQKQIQNVLDKKEAYFKALQETEVLKDSLKSLRIEEKQIDSNSKSEVEGRKMRETFLVDRSTITDFSEPKELRENKVVSNVIDIEQIQQKLTEILNHCKNLNLSEIKKQQSEKYENFRNTKYSEGTCSENSNFDDTSLNEESSPEWVQRKSEVTEDSQQYYDCGDSIEVSSKTSIKRKNLKTKSGLLGSSITQVNLAYQEINDFKKKDRNTDRKEKQQFNKTSIYKGKQNLIDNFKAENILTLMANMDSPYHKGFIHPEELLSVAKQSISTTQMNYKHAEKITKMWKKGRKIQLDEFVHACKHPKDYIDFLKKENKYKKEILKWKNQKFSMTDENFKRNNQTLIPSQGCRVKTTNSKKAKINKQRRNKNIQDSFKDYTNKIAQSLNKGSKSFATALTKNTLVNHVPLSRPTNKQKCSHKSTRVSTKKNIICKEKSNIEKWRNEYTSNRFNKVTEKIQHQNYKPLQLNKKLLRKSL